MVWRSEVLIGRRYLAISGAKQEAEFRAQAREDLASRVEHTCAAFRRLLPTFVLEY
jgi:hypothetical protein